MNTSFKVNIGYPNPFYFFSVLNVQEKQDILRGKRVRAVDFVHQESIK